MRNTEQIGPKGFSWIAKNCKILLPSARPPYRELPLTMHHEVAQDFRPSIHSNKLINPYNSPVMGPWAPIGVQSVLHFSHGFIHAPIVTK